MKKYFFIFIVLSSKLFSQEIDNLKPRDTIYLSFKNDEQFNYVTSKEEKKGHNSRYWYQFPDAKQLSFFTLPNEKIYKKLRKQIVKDKIFGIEAIYNSGFSKSVNTMYNKKIVIYLINKYDCAKRKVSLKRVYLENVIHSEM